MVATPSLLFNTSSNHLFMFGSNLVHCEGNLQDKAYFFKKGKALPESELFTPCSSFGSNLVDWIWNLQIDSNAVALSIRTLRNYNYQDQFWDGPRWQPRSKTQAPVAEICKINNKKLPRICKRSDRNCCPIWKQFLSQIKHHVSTLPGGKPCKRSPWGKNHVSTLTSHWKYVLTSDNQKCN